MKQMQMAFSQVEKFSNLIGNLQQLKARGEVDETTYQQFFNQYNQQCAEATQQLNAIRQQLQADLDRLVTEDKALESELQNIQLRVRIGEIPTEQAPAVMGKVQKKREALTSRMRALQAAVNAKSSADLGGYMAEVPVRRSFIQSDGAAGTDWFGSLRAKLAPYLPLGRHRRPLQIGAGVAFCVMCLIVLFRAFACYQATKFVSGVQGLASMLGAPADMLAKPAGASTFAGSLSAFLMIALAVGFIVSAVGYFKSARWADIVAFVVCVGGIVVAIIANVLLGGMVGAIARSGMMLPELTCLYGVFVALVPADDSSAGAQYY